MWEWMTNLSSLAVFLAIGAAGFIFLLISFLFSELIGHLEFGGDIESDLSHDGPGVLSLRTVSIFLTALGGLGALAKLQGYGTAVSSSVGLAGGTILAGIVYYYARFLFQQQASSIISSADLIGQRADVTVGIPANGSGQVRCLIGESMVDKIARAVDGSAIPFGAKVVIDEVSGESVIVSPWRALDEGRSLFSSLSSEDRQIPAAERKRSEE
jgi:hypothetical protein